VLRLIARHGAAGLYHGDVAAAIIEDMQAHGGLLRRDDLASYEAVVRPPARLTYRGYEVLTAAIPHGGTTVLQTLHILAQLDLRGLTPDSPAYLHRFIEAARHAFADRYYYLGDSHQVDVPLAGLLSREYATALAGQIDLTAARLGTRHAIEPWVEYATRARHDPWAYEGRSRPGAAVPSMAADGDCTTHFSVVDTERNMVSCTQTAVGLFGAKVVTPGLGLLWNNAMIWFNPQPGAANSIAPWKRPLTNMAPLLALSAGKPALSIGAPGGRRIMNCNTQVFLNIAQFGMGIQEAIAQPRVDASTRDTLVDSRLDAATIEALAALGHQLQVVEETAAEVHFATPLGILVDHTLGTLHSGVDVFRIAAAGGY
jgi:gamma-glutamyltranspeptidase/glutathione hydrolase